MTRRRVLLALTFLAIACACMTLLWLGMRSVMDVGGTCASGNTAFEIRQQCPEGAAAAVPIGIVGGVIALIAYVAMSVGSGGLSVAMLAWPVLFLSLGWNFLENGIDGPGDAGLVWGWLLCGVMFVVMGAAPLLLASGTGPVRSRRQEKVNPELMRSYRAEIAELETLHRTGVLTQADYDAQRRKFPETAFEAEGLSRAMKAAHVFAALAGVALGYGLWQLLVR